MADFGPLQYMGVRGPEPASYQIPSVDFSWLGNLPQRAEEAYSARLANELRKYELRQYQDFYGNGGPGASAGLPSQASASAASTPSAPVTAASYQPASTDPGSVNDRLFHATHGQESNYGANPSTSAAGARGDMQIMPKTWAANALPNERIDSREDNLRVGRRILDKYLARYNGDWSRAAVAYYSGEGNVSPPGSPTPWKRNIQPPRRGEPNVAQYVQQIGAKMFARTPPPVQQPVAPGAPGAPGVASYDRNLTPQQVAATGLTPQEAATDRAAVANGGVGTSAPAPQGEFPAPSEAQGGPPFAPMLTASASPSASGPANIRLASASNDLTGVLPTPQTPSAGPLMAGLTPRTAAAPMGPQPAAAIVPQGPTPQQQPVRMAEAPGATQPVPPARAPASPVAREPESDPRIRSYDAQMDAIQRRLDVVKRFAIPPAQREAEQLQVQQGRLLQERNTLYERLTHERSMQLDTVEQDKRGRQAAQTAVEKKESEDTLAYLRSTSEEGLESRAHLGQLEQIRTLGENAPYGGLALLKQQLGKYGIQTQGLTDIQAYQAAIDFMAPQLRPPGSGRLMANEMSGFKAALGGLMTTPEGRSIAVDNLSLMSRYKMQIGKIARQTDISPAERLEKISEVPFPHLRTEAPSAPGAPGGTPGKLPPGKYRYNPDGSLTPQ